MEVFALLKDLYKLFKSLNLKETVQIGHFYNDSLHLLKAFKDIIMIGNSVLSTLGPVCTIKDKITEEKLTLVLVNNSKKFVAYKDKLLLFKDLWLS